MNMVDCFQVVEELTLDGSQMLRRRQIRRETRENRQATVAGWRTGLGIRHDHGGAVKFGLIVLRVARPRDRVPN